MRSFDRYFILYCIISALIFLFVIVMNFFTTPNLNKPIVLIVLSLSLLMFSFVMSLIFSSYSHVEIVRIYPQSDEDICKVESYFIEKCGRKQIEMIDNKREFSYKNKIKKWLTEPICVSSNNDNYVVSMPSYYSEEFKKKFFGMLCKE